MKTQKLVSKKCEYALRALFELARATAGDPMKIQDIASAQGIPSRFLEIILVELKNGGFVLSRRGSSGGYTLSRNARDIGVGEVIRFFQGRLRNSAWDRVQTDRMGDIAFSRLWERIRAAISEVYDQTTLDDLVQEEMASRCAEAPNYVI